MIKFTEIVSCNGTVLYQVIGSQLNFITSGKLSVLIAEDGLLLIKLNDFEYGISSDAQIVYDDQDPQFSLVFSLMRYPNGRWVLKVNENSDSLFSCLNQKCYLKNKRAGTNEPVEGNPSEHRSHKVQMQKKEPEEESVFVGASRQISKGLVFTGKMLSKGFQQLGGFISRKVSKQKEVKVAESTKDNIKLVSNTTKKVLKFTSQQVGNLFRFGKKVVGNVGEKLEKTEKGQQVQENPYYKPVKEGAITSVKVIANLYSGAVGAVYAVGSGISKGATQVIEAKYGKDAGEASDGVFEGVGNVGKMYRIPVDQAAKQLS